GEHVVDRRAAPAIDSLVHVADRADELGARAEAADELALGDVRVLVLVQEDVTEAGSEALEHLRPLVEEPDGGLDLVAEGERGRSRSAASPSSPSRSACSRKIEAAKA